MEAQAEAIQQIRRVLTSIERLQTFVKNFTSTLAGFRPLQQCINTVVRLNTCGRCVAVRPPFCQNVCRAIARACYSPFNDALEDQLELFWEVVRRILDRAAEAIEELNENRGFLDVDLSTLVSDMMREEGGRVGEGEGREREKEGGREGGREREMVEGGGGREKEI